MIKFVLGFATGAALVLALVFLRILTPGTVRTAAKDPQRGVAAVTDNVVRQVKEGARNLRTNKEAAAMVKGKTGQDAACRREGMSTRHVCRTRDKKMYRVMGDQVLLFKGDVKVLDPDLTAWAEQAFADAFAAGAAEVVKKQAASGGAP